MRYELLTNCIGKTLGQDIIDENNLLILAAGTEITETLVRRLQNFGIYYLSIKEPLTDDLDITNPISDQTIITAANAIASLDIDKAFEAADKIVADMTSNSAILGNGFMILREYDENTAFHSISVAVFSIMLGMSLGLSMVRLRNLSVGALLHDIGKSQIPIEILNKTGSLTAEETELMRQHPKYGYNMVKDDVLMPIPVKSIILQHHENWDGSGYPRKLKEDKIYELASITHICDVFDALISKRSYKEAFSYKDSLDYMESMRGIMFNPYCLDYFFSEVPIYKVGLKVTLNTGETAIVVKNTRGDMRRPIIRMEATGQDINLREVPVDELFIES
ncbi:MAG: HD-GYP domain-containing protein [Pseudobutyrivibrio sp.]|nr:HD-GYP domain-containing protein [Pseudobutyrivibrio sp.]